MKKVLYTEYYFNPGHVNFNRLHIEALRRQNCEVQIICHRPMAEQLGYPKENFALILPCWLIHKDGFPIYNRLLFLLTLLYIKLRVPMRSFHKVILADFDEISLTMCPLCKGMYIICHGNGASFASRLKALCLKRLAKSNHFIVFHEGQAAPFREHDIQNVKIVSHGCVEPYVAPQKTADALPLDDYRFIVFHPSNNPDEDFIRQLTCDAQLNEYLERENILLILRKQPSDYKPTRHIKFIDGFLSQDIYRHYFLRANAIFMAYPPSFRFQVSGVSFECIANHKPLIVLHRTELEYCRQYYNYNPMVHNTKDFLELLQRLITDPSLGPIVPLGEKPQSGPAANPDYSEILQ